jgi:hypothetical protein
VWGIARRSWQLVLLGTCGILFTVLIYGALFYFGFVQRGGIYDKLRSQLAVTMLNDTVKEIEFFKLQNGHYPANLDEIQSKEKTHFNNMMDPTWIERPGSKFTQFYYELGPAGTFYFLRSVGPDDIPFTIDDILPSISENDQTNVGLRTKK